MANTFFGVSVDMMAVGFYVRLKPRRQNWCWNYILDKIWITAISSLDSTM